MSEYIVLGEVKMRRRRTGIMKISYFVENTLKMSDKGHKRVCPAELAGSLDNSLRRLLQDPREILQQYIREGITVLDLGCGPGYFTTEIAKMLNSSGKVIAADLQEGMLDKVRRKIKGTALEQRIELHKCDADSIDVSDTVDFILCFYMVHEVPDQYNLFKELKSILRPEGKLYIIEPKFHVTKKSFNEMVNKLDNIGFEVIESPKVFFSRTVLLKVKN
jgi:ubiquinone/menaquinone biosynthesis C-methylase UbiE